MYNFFMPISKSVIRIQSFMHGTGKWSSMRVGVYVRGVYDSTALALPSGPCLLH